MSATLILIVVPHPTRKLARPVPRTNPTVRPTGTNPDRGLRRCVECALQALGHRLLRRVAVSVRDGHVTLGGTVPSFYLKQLSQTAALAVPGVRGLSNNLSVPGPESRARA